MEAGGNVGKFLMGEFEHLAPLSLWLAMVASLYSGAEYFVRFGPELVKRNGPEQG